MAVKYECPSTPTEIYYERLAEEQTTDSLANSLRHSTATAMQIRIDQLFNKRLLNTPFCLQALLMWTPIIKRQKVTSCGLALATQTVMISCCDAKPSLAQQERKSHIGVVMLETALIHSFVFPRWGNSLKKLRFFRRLRFHFCVYNFV